MQDTFSNINIDKQERIKEAAFKEFAEHGYRNASTNRLVKNLGISKGSLFKYFKSKLELYTYLVDIASLELVDHMSQFSSNKEATIKEKIVSYAAMEYDYLIKFPIKYKFFFQLQRDIMIPELENAKELITSIATSTTKDFLYKVGVNDREGLGTHLKLILSSYNQFFMENIDSETDWSKLRSAYIQGLSKHLDYVDWRRQ